MWELESGAVRHVIKNSELFIGRLPVNLSNIVRDYTPLKVYIYYPRIKVAYHTGHESLTVSRLHTKIIVGSGGKVIIKDHGPKGSGSKNGLIVNGIRLPRGDSRELRPGDSFRLGCLGPSFTLLTETPKGITLLLEEGVPTYLPKSLAKELSASERIKVLYVVGNEAIVLPVGSGEFRLGNYVIKNEGISSREALLKIISKMQCRIADAIELYHQGERERLVDTLKELSLDVFRRAINELGDEELKEEYKWLIKQVSNALYVDESLIIERLRRIRRMIEDVIDLKY